MGILRGLQLKFEEAEKEHGSIKFKKAIRLAMITQRDIFYWLELEEETIDMKLGQYDFSI